MLTHQSVWLRALGQYGNVGESMVRTLWLHRVHRVEGRHS